MKRYSVLILGASVMQVPAIEAAKSMGWTVCVADRDAGAPGAGLADEFLPVDLSDKEGMLEAAKVLIANDGLDGVFTAGTDFSATVAYVSENLGLPGIPFEVALNASDKARMRAVFARAELPSPRFAAVDSGADPRGAVVDLGFPLVVKPVDNMGARGVRRVDTADELTAAFEIAGEYSRTGKVIIEEYIEGPEFSLDALVYNGQISLCGIADRHIRFPPFFVEVGHTMPSDASEDVQKAVIELFFDGIRALGITNGAAKGDIKYSASGPVIGEIAARLSGGYMSGWTYPYSSGVNLTAAGLEIAVGLPPRNLAPILRKTAAERAFFSIPGVVREISGASKPDDPAVRECFPRVDVGHRVDFPQNNVEKCGNYISVADDRTTAVRASVAACNGVFIRLEPNDDATRRFLYGNTHVWVPDAFDLEGLDGDTRNAVKSELASMPPYSGPNLASGVESGALSIVSSERLRALSIRDWQERRLRDSLDAVTRITGVGFSFTPTQLGSIFWRAFLRGGVQAGVWCIDSILQSGLSRFAATLRGPARDGSR